MQKKPNLKIIFLGILSLSFLFSLPATANFENNNVEYYGYGQESITRTLSQEEILAYKMKDIEVERYIKQKEQQRKELTDFTKLNIHNSLAVPPKMQEKTYWCGPASALQVIAYIKGNLLPTQQQLADNWDVDKNKYGMNTEKYGGTTCPDMARSMNYWLDESWYVSRTEDDATNLWNKFVFSIDYKHPANILVDTKYLSWYNGKSFSHFITVRGYHDWYYGDQEIDLVDPHYSSTYYGYRNYEPYDNVFSAVNAQSWRPNLVY